MAKLFFAKMNINDEIYEIYDGKKQISSLLNKIYNDINNSTEVYDEKGGKYKFFNIDKLENNIIIGRLGYIKEGTHSSYDPENDKAIDIVDKNKLEYITFYFDVDKEMIGFNTKFGFNKKKFTETFARLIKKSADIGVELIIEANINDLKKELKKISTLRRIKIKLVPPNGDEPEFADLFSIDSERLKEARITQVKQELATRTKEGLDKNSTAVNKIISGVGLGYAEVEFIGKDNQGKEKEVKSTEDAPRTKFISKELHNDKNEISESSRAEIFDILAYKTSIRERNSNGKGEQI